MTITQARAAIRERLTKLEAMHRNYLAYQQYRVDERDHHGARDVAINLAETEAEMAGIRLCFEYLDQVDQSTEVQQAALDAFGKGCEAGKEYARREGYTNGTG